MININCLGILNFKVDIKKGLELTSILSDELIVKFSDKANRLKPLVLDYLKSNNGVSVSQIAEHFEISYEDAFYILKLLEKDRKIVIS